MRKPGRLDQREGEGDPLRAAFEEAPIGTALIEVAPEGLGRFLQVNRAACDLLGYDEAELLAMKPQDLTLAADVDRDREVVESLVRGEVARSRVEKRVVHRGGDVVWVQVDRSLVRDVDGRPRFIVAHALDVTEQRRATQLLHCERVVARVLAHSVTGEGAVAALLPGIAEVLERDAAFAWMLDDTGKELTCEAAWQSRATRAAATVSLARQIALGPGMGLPGRVWTSQAADFVHDMSQDPTCPRAGAAAVDGLHGGIAFPVMAGTTLLGVVELLSDRPEASPELLEVLGTVGRELGGFYARRRVKAADGSHLLLVEDDDFIATLVGEMLAGAQPGLELVRVGNLAEARDRVLSSQPACVLLDLTLPDADGLQGLLELRKLAPEVPIVVLTGHEDESLAVRAVQEGAQDYLVKRKVDMDSLARSIRYARERKRTERRVFEDVLHDGLTGLPNRALVLDRLRVAVSRVQGQHGQVALLLLDLDRFRRINDSLGYRGGDQVIAEIGSRLSAEQGGDSTVAALGADRFAVLCEFIEDPRVAVDVGEKVLSSVSRPILVDGKELRLDATVGIALSDDALSDPEELIHEAEIARDRARGRGASYEIFEESARNQVRETMDVESGLRRAIEEGELRLVYQPVASLESGRVVACEALLRWEHPERGLLAPGEFISVAEESGLIVPIGEWVLAEACRQLARWKSAGVGDHLRVNINLSPAQVGQPDLPERVAVAIADAGIDPADVCLEITESSLIDVERSPLETLEALKAHGVDLALDDFGTGYSSLSYLRRYPIDELKIDRSLVTGLGDDEQLAAIVTAIVQMGTTLGMPVVAEGVETSSDVRRLRELLCHRAQGYYLARPLTAADAAAVINEGVSLGAGSARG